MTPISDSEREFEAAGPILHCRAAKGDLAGDWDAAKGVFRDAETLAMRQFWMDRQEAHFRPCTVRCVWTPDSLWVLAELEDDDIFNPVTQFNEPAFAKGDAFEMFLKPPRQEAYYEFHVSPENQRFQLRIPGRGLVSTSVRVAGFQIDSRARVLPAQRRWEVLAGIPFAHVAEAGSPVAGDRWLFSFSRYDYTRGMEKPVLSSTSPHPKCNFHRMEDWGTLVLEG